MGAAPQPSPAAAYIINIAMTHLPDAAAAACIINSITLTFQLLLINIVTAAATYVINIKTHLPDSAAAAFIINVTTSHSAAYVINIVPAADATYIITHSSCYYSCCSWHAYFINTIADATAVAAAAAAAYQINIRRHRQVLLH